MDLTRRQFGKAMAGAAASLALPIGFTLKESKEETAIVDGQFYVTFVAPPKETTKQQFHDRYLAPALIALSNHMKDSRANRVGKITVSRFYDFQSDQELFRVDALTTTTKNLPPRVIKQLGGLDLRRLKLGQEISTG